MLNRIATLVISVSISFLAAAQESDPFLFANRVIPATETYSISQYGKDFSSTNTGEMRYSLPIYTYKDEDFNIPITLEYHYDGYKPDHHSGTVGMGWHLNCGGVITRKVVGLPDDYISKDGEPRKYGYYYVFTDFSITDGGIGNDNSGLVDSLSRRSFFNDGHITSWPTPSLMTSYDLSGFLGSIGLANKYSIPYIPSDVAEEYYDISSDVYHFSLPGISGDFIIQSDGTAKVFNSSIPEGELSVEILFQPMTDSFSYSEIIIRTNDGYSYEFGSKGDVGFRECMNYIDYSFEAARVGIVQENDPNNLCFSALYLRTIKAPSGREMLLQRSSPISFEMFYQDSVQSPFFEYSIDSIGTIQRGYNARTYSTLKTVFHHPLQGLIVDGKEIISFNYQNKEHNEFSLKSFLAVDSAFYSSSLSAAKVDGESAPLNWYKNEKRLSSIIVRNQADFVIDSITLFHGYSSESPGHSPKMFLITVRGNNGRYCFSYNNASPEDEYPPVDVQDKDHWGYWRGSVEKYSYSDSLYQRSSLYDLPLERRSPDSTRTSYAALQRIDYPTGGYTVIEYECNYADRKLDISSLEPDTYRIVDSCDYRVGGVRVKKVSNFAGPWGSNADSIEYDYCNSGILLKMPRYILPVLAAYALDGTTIEPLNGGPFQEEGHYSMMTINNHGISAFGRDNHICYSKIKTTYQDQSYKEVYYSDYQQSPNEYAHDYPLDSLIVIDKILKAWPEFDSTLRYYYFDAGDTTKRRIKTNIQLANILTCDKECMRDKVVAELMYDADSVLLQQTKYTWSPERVASGRGLYNAFSDFIIAYRYFIQPRLSSVIVTDFFPDGHFLSDTTSYTYNSHGQQRIVEHRGFDGDIRRSRFSYEHESDATAPPANVAAVATSRLYVDGNNRSEYLTSLRHFEYDPDSARRHLPILSQEFCSKAPRFPVVNDGGIEWFAPKSTDDTLVRRLSYNAMQRPALLSLPGGAYVAFTWDASGRYPLSREDNGPAMVSSYQWKDMVGLTRRTDPTLRSEWYGYDDKCRLSEVRRADSIKVTAYDYHLWCEDSTQGPSYTKQTTWRTSGKNNREIVYYDGLGYPIQKVRTSTQTTGGHIVTPIRYDALRRDDVKAYLPYEALSSNYDSTDSTQQSLYYKFRYGNGEVYPFAEKEYGTSPAGRLLSARQPGKAYADSAKRIVYEYRTNTLADSILNLYATVDTLPKLKVGSGYLSSSRLLLTKTTDEDGCTSEVFTNSTGKTVLSRQRTGGARLDTYYVYDLRDSLVCVLQPEGAARITLGSVHDILRPTGINSADTIPQIGSLLSEYAFLYAYDSHGRLVAKKLPGAAAEEFIPDDRGRIVLSRNGNLRTAGKWLYNEYDNYDALLRSSLISANVGLDTLRKAARGQVDIIYPDTTWMWPYYYPQDQEIVLYGRTAILAAGDSLFTPELDYTGNVESAGNDPILGRYIVFEMERYYVGASAVGFPDGETTVVNWPGFFAAAITDSTLLEEHRYDRGDSPAVPAALAFTPVTGIVSQGDLGSTRNMELWQRQLLLPPGRTVPGDMLCYVERAFYYDTPGNTVQTVERNALGGISRTSAKYDYLGNVLSSEESHAAGPAATADRIRKTFAYDTQGRVATETASLPGRGVATTFFDNDIFGHPTHSYWANEEHEMSEFLSYDIRGRLSSKEVYRIVAQGGGGEDRGDDEEEEEPEDPEVAEDQFLFGQYLRYHSPLKAASQRRWNGLISEIAHQRTDTGTVITNGYFYDHAGRLTDHIRYDGISQTNKYTERDLSFDRNGNILSLKRFGTNVAAPQDNLAYTYEGNKLMQLNGSTYQYDANGNMTHDGRRGLDLSWNHLNLPSSICSDEDEDALVNYTYLTDGTKVITQQPATGEGYAYLGTATYKLVNNVWTLESVPFTGGRFIANSTGGMDEYRYITDHLGSTRVIVTGTDYHEVEHDDYYPFGKRIADNTLPTTQNNRWRFSGKEIQTLGGIGLVDFGARLYDDFSGRWKTQDALIEKYFSLSSYGYCTENPINLIDPFGQDIYYFDSDGNYLYKEKTNDMHIIAVSTADESGSVNYRYYLFADSQNDPLAIDAGIINRLEFIDNESIITILKNQGLFESNVITFLLESRGGGRFDYSDSALSGEYINNNSRGEKVSSVLYLPEGETVAHNLMNFGNYLWGASGAIMGIPAKVLRRGANLNSLIFPIFNGYCPQLDSKDDQLSILLGYYHALDNSLSRYRKSK